MFVSYTVTELELQRAGASESLALDQLGEIGETAYFGFFEDWNDSCQYEVVTRVNGAYQDEAKFAVYAVWQLEDADRSDEFVNSRKNLFHLRRKLLPTFRTDFLLRRLDNESRFMVLGLYGDDAGAATLSRQHLEIQDFAAANPLEGIASDTSGVKVFKVRSHRVGEPG